MSREIPSKFDLTITEPDINTFPVAIILHADLCHASFMFLLCLAYFTPSLSCPGATDSASSSSSSSSSFVNGATSKNLPAVQTVAPMPEDTMENMRSELLMLQSSVPLQPFTSFFCSSSFMLFFYLDLSVSSLVVLPSHPGPSLTSYLGLSLLI